jgi:tetratricopeptide (TPR) repeat protein
MDIWRWVNELQDELVDNGRARLAELIDAIPNAVVNHHHVELDAAVPEALALAREAKNPWLEVFIRHWNLQSRVLHRHEVSAFLPEAVRLIEFASREETRECPQSVCVTQDLAGCYTKLDGPGYAQERLDVAHETLSRIDARWPCFTCISSEVALALVDRGETDEALAFLDRQAAELDSVGRGAQAKHLSSARIEAYFAQQRFEDALQLARREKARSSDENDRESHGLDCASALAQLGRNEEALDELLPFERVLPTHSLYARWSEAVHALAIAGAIPNDHRLDGQLFELAESLRENGVARTYLELQHRRASLALARKRLETAEECARSIRAGLPRLRAPLGADRALEALEQAIEAQRATAPPLEAPASVEALIAALSEDPERDLALIHATAKRFPDDERVVILEASAQRFRRHHAEADARLRSYLADNPWAYGCLMNLGRSLLDRRQPAEVRTLAAATLDQDPPSEVAAGAQYLIALAYRQEGENARARLHLERLLSLQPGAVVAELLLAAIDREEGKLDSALARLDRIIEDDPTPGHADWDRMVVATLLGRWDKVRASAARVGIKLEGEGPIDEPWSLCRIEIPEADGQRTIHHAIRTGPVSARIIEVAKPRDPQHYGDEIVFDAQPRNAPPKEGEEQGHTFLFPLLAVRKEGGYRAFLVDGAHPGDEALAALRDEIAAAGGVLSVRSDETYTIEDSEGEEETKLPGLFAYLAWPPARPLLEAHELLRRRASGYALPLVWPGLAQELGLEDEMAEQALTIDRYGL